ncbi:MAG: hypothetical protein ACLVHL_04230 [Collinsella intestinalis]
MGHISWRSVSHIWYFRPDSFPMSRMLDLKSKDLEKVLLRELHHHPRRYEA